MKATGSDWFELNPGYTVVDSEKPRPDASKPKRLSTAGTKIGGDPNGVCAGNIFHLASDLQVGDRVGVETAQYDGRDEFAYEVSIMRRPGGKIPPMTGHPTFNIPRTLHLRLQAYQDWEEKRIPIPKEYLDEKGRCKYTNPPYPLPEAPPPRPAKP